METSFLSLRQVSFDFRVTRQVPYSRLLLQGRCDACHILARIPRLLYFDIQCTVHLCVVLCQNRMRIQRQSVSSLASPHSSILLGSVGVPQSNTGSSLNGHRPNQHRPDEFYVQPHRYLALVEARVRCRLEKVSTSRTLSGDEGWWRCLPSDTREYNDTQVVHVLVVVAQWCGGKGKVSVPPSRLSCCTPTAASHPLVFHQESSESVPVVENRTRP
jgi:hypothetical protein